MLLGATRVKAVLKYVGEINTGSFCPFPFKESRVQKDKQVKINLKISNFKALL